MRALIGALCVLCFSGLAAAQTVAPHIQVLQDTSLSDNESKHAVTAAIDWPAGSTTGWHTHPGDEYAVVVEGEVEVTVKDQKPRIYKAGESYHNARDVVHETRAVGSTPAKTIAVLVVDKGAPLTQPH